MPGDTRRKKRIDALAAELLSLVEAEALWPKLVWYHEVIARAYLAIADRKNARRHSELSEEWWIHYGGLDHDNVDGVRTLWKDVLALDEWVSAWGEGFSNTFSE